MKIQAKIFIYFFFVFFSFSFVVLYILPISNSYKFYTFNKFKNALCDLLTQLLSKYGSILMLLFWVCLLFFRTKKNEYLSVFAQYRCLCPVFEVFPVFALLCVSLCVFGYLCASLRSLGVFVVFR